MAMNIRDLSVQRRDATGKGPVRRLRRAGLVPAILYGGGTEPVSLAVADPQLPEGVRVTVATTQAIVTVTPPMAEEVAPVVAAPAAEPEVVTERKPKEEEEVKPEGKAKK